MNKIYSNIKKPNPIRPKKNRFRVSLKAFQSVNSRVTSNLTTACTTEVITIPKDVKQMSEMDPLQLKQQRKSNL